MLGKVLWSGLAAALAGLAAVGARQLASTIWRPTAKEEPPGRR